MRDSKHPKQAEKRVTRQNMTETTQIHYNSFCENKQMSSNNVPYNSHKTYLDMVSKSNVQKKDIISQQQDKNLLMKI